MIERKQFCQILDALGCSCSPPVPGTDTGWALNAHCLMHPGPNREPAATPEAKERRS